ncbi:hypothetical protein [Micromonospora sp. CB01531]|uniref:hypothetical protein n=1 Tax=Micromonospora sp. CB01531 TaxID=1718947 RepID=UPI00093CDE3D|nr:hypothetical protein [Micromonospora sp. CB01531]OKI46769.1 hypothetical protein A6A27_36905 [Micromonospora sp. CB01531]
MTLARRALPDRRADAVIPDEATFAAKPAPDRQIVTATLDDDMPTGWVTGDEVYGAPTQDGEPNLNSAGVGYLLVVGGVRHVAVLLPPRPLVVSEPASPRQPSIDTGSGAGGPTGDPARPAFRCGLRRRAAAPGGRGHQLAFGRRHLGQPHTVPDAVAHPFRQPEPDTAAEAWTLCDTSLGSYEGGCDNDFLTGDTCDAAYYSKQLGGGALDAFIENKDDVNETRLRDCPQFLADWKKAKTGFTDGSYEVGAEVKPGTYQTITPPQRRQGGGLLLGTDRRQRNHQGQQASSPPRRR